MNHPNRSQIRFPARLLDIDGSPSPDWVLGRRINSNLTQEQAAELLYTSKRSYQQWEYGDRQMHPAMWALFLIRTEKYIPAEKRASWYGNKVENNQETQLAREFEIVDGIFQLSATYVGAVVPYECLTDDAIDENEFWHCTQGVFIGADLARLIEDRLEGGVDLYFVPSRADAMRTIAALRAYAEYLEREFVNSDRAIEWERREMDRMERLENGT